LVNTALKKSENIDQTKSDPKVIVVKQETPKDEDEDEDEEEWDYSQVYAYPPDYYENDEYEDDEYEDDE
jgi:hypothetical protein